MGTMHELIPVAGEFINKVGFPIAMWIAALFIFYKVMAKLYKKIEPIFQEAVDNHFNLVKALQENSSTTVHLIGELKDNAHQTVQTLQQLSETLTNQNSILLSHSDKLDEIKGTKCPIKPIEKVVPLDDEHAPTIALVKTKRPG